MSPKFSIFHFCQLLHREVLCSLFKISRKKTVNKIFKYIDVYITLFILYEKIILNLLLCYIPFIKKKTSIKKEKVVLKLAKKLDR
jgi:hypothetical protein